MDEKLDWLKDVTVAQNSKVSENALIKNVVKLFTENEETRKAFAVKHQELLDTINSLKEQNDSLNENLKV